MEILEWHQSNGGRQQKTIAYFKEHGCPQISQPSLSRWLQQSSSLKAKFAAGVLPSTRRTRTQTNPQFEQMMSMWINSMESNKVNGITGEVIRGVGSKFYDRLDVPLVKRLQLSNGWLAKFKRRQGLRFFRFHGEAASAPLQNLEGERARLQALTQKYVEDGYTLDDIYNLDEMAFFYAATPNQGLAREARAGYKKIKTRMTLALCVNASSTDPLPPLYIGKAKQPRCFKKKNASDLGFQYFSNQNAWMTKSIFQAFLLKWNKQLSLENRKIVLILDNFKGHAVEDDRIQNISLEFFEPNLTAFIQPCDAGIIRTFKAIYRKLLVERLIDDLMNETVGSNLFKIDSLEAMYLSKRAWESLKPTTFVHCWQHNKILPEPTYELSLVPNEDDSEFIHVVEMLGRRMSQLKSQARTRGRPIDLVSITDFIDANESDDLALARLEIDQIADLVLNPSQQEEEDQEDQEVNPRITMKEALRAMISLDRFFIEKGGVDGELMRSLHHERNLLRTEMLNRSVQKEITNYFPA